ncbi:hypothetical protein D3C76_1494050 [compost metagenome]
MQARGQLFLFMAVPPRHFMFQQRQHQQAGSENAQEEHRGILENQHQITAQIFQKRQADTHEKQDHVNHPAQQTVNGLQ